MFWWFCYVLTLFVKVLSVDNSNAVKYWNFS